MDQMALLQQNAAARNVLLNNGVDMTQSIFSTTVSSNIAGTVLNIPLQNVGFVKRLYVRLKITLAQTAAETFTRSGFGPANFLSQVILTDLNNQTRINTTGWHLHYLATARRKFAFGAAYTNDSPTSVGSNYNVIAAPSPITTAQDIYMVYEIPVSYSDFDLRGGMWMNVVNSTATLQLTINPNFVVASGASNVLACYRSSTSSLGTLSNCQVEVFQNYIDQVPADAKTGMPILPLVDMSTAYLLNNTNKSGLSTNQDQAIPYANFRQFMSTTVIFDQNGTLNAGGDVAYFALQSANYTNIWKYPVQIEKLLERNIISDDMPVGMYYFDHRNRPVNTIQYGNMQLIVNPSNVSSAQSQFLIGFEALALINQVTNAGSLYQN